MGGDSYLVEVLVSVSFLCRQLGSYVQYGLLTLSELIKTISILSFPALQKKQKILFSKETKSNSIFKILKELSIKS